jgi:uncharacterized membrane protein YbhN (UPF0104 family)
MDSHHHTFTSLDFWNIVFSALFLILAGTASYYYSNELFRISTFDGVVVALAIFRLVRLATYDKITSWKRDFFSRYEGGLGRSIYEMLICPWCTGIWVALVVVPLYLLVPQAFLFVLILAFAGVGTLIQLFANMLSRIGK